MCVRVFAAAAAAAAAVSIALAAGLASHASTSAVIRPASDGGREGKERDGVAGCNLSGLLTHTHTIGKERRNINK